MRVALVHSFYSDGEASGENQIVLQQAALLESAGFTVAVLGVDSTVLQQQSLYEVRTAWNLMRGRGASFHEEIKVFQPDIVHVHNLFPNISPDWISRINVPVVATVHNYRLTCANGLLFRDGQPCQSCVGNRGLAGIRHGCYRNSRLASTAVVSSRQHAKRAYARFSIVVCPSEAVRQLLITSGMPTRNLEVLPHAVGVEVAESTGISNGRWLFVGRLSPEKGLADLLKEWPLDFQLDVIGSGDEAAALSQVDAPSVRFLGGQSRDYVLSRMPDYEGLVFPSQCFEVQPTVVIEAMASGIPIVALEGNAGATLIRDWKCGVTYGVVDGQLPRLSEALLRAQFERTELGRRGQQALLERFSNSVWVNSISALYERALLE